MGKDKSSGAGGNYKFKVGVNTMRGIQTRNSLFRWTGYAMIFSLRLWGVERNIFEGSYETVLRKAFESNKSYL